MIKELLNGKRHINPKIISFLLESIFVATAIILTLEVIGIDLIGLYR